MQTTSCIYIRRMQHAFMKPRENNIFYAKYIRLTFELLHWPTHVRTTSPPTHAHHLHSHTHAPPPLPHMPILRRNTLTADNLYIADIASTGESSISFNMYARLNGGFLSGSTLATAVLVSPSCTCSFNVCVH